MVRLSVNFLSVGSNALVTPFEDQDAYTMEVDQPTSGNWLDKFEDDSWPVGPSWSSGLVSAAVLVRGGDPQVSAIAVTTASEIARNTRSLQRNKTIIYTRNPPPLYMLLNIGELRHVSQNSMHVP